MTHPFPHVTNIGVIVNSLFSSFLSLFNPSPSIVSSISKLYGKFMDSSPCWRTAPPLRPPWVAAGQQPPRCSPVPSCPSTAHSPCSTQGTFKLFLLDYITSWFFFIKKMRKHPSIKLLSVAHKELQLASPWHIGNAQLYLLHTYIQHNTYNKEGFLRETPKQRSSPTTVIAKEGQGGRKADL